MQTFRPARAPRTNLADLAAHVDRELSGVQTAANTGSDGLPLNILFAEPDRPQEGWLYEADGTYWNPGSGAGVYRYTIDATTSIGSFVYLGAAAGLITASGLTMNTARLLGRTTASVGAVEEITVGTGLSLSAGALAATGGVGSGGAGVGEIQAIPLFTTDETTALTTGTKLTARMPYGFSLIEVKGGVTTAATGATKLAFDVKGNGVSLFSTKPTFDAGEKTTFTASVPSVLSSDLLAEDMEMTLIVDAVGSTIAGAGLKAWLVGYATVVIPPSAFATWNPSDKDAGCTLTNSNLTSTGEAARSTVGVSSGKWYWEYTNNYPGSGDYQTGGIGTSAATLTKYAGEELTSFGVVPDSSYLYHNNAVLSGPSSGWSGSVVIGIALDMDARTLTIYRDGVLIYAPYGIAAGTWYAMSGSKPGPGVGASVTANFGASAFTYAVPAGFNPGLYTI